jgi:RimJ/RimL family protein N-acetyltransferase
MPPPKSLPKRLETKRLILRIPALRDAKTLNREVLASMPRLKPWLPWAKTAPSLADSRKQCRKAIRNHRIRKDLTYLMFDKDTGALVGGIGLHRIDWNVPRLEIGYWIGTRHEGQGYVTEAVRSLGDLAFRKLGAARVELHCDGKNTKSRRVAELAGYRLEGILRQHRRDNRGRLCDMCVFARTRLKK